MPDLGREETHVRASRLVAIILLLQSRGRVTARDIADELGITVRTAYRDIVALQTAGIPVFGESGVGGGYRLVDGYRTRLTGLTSAEAEALVLMGLPGAAAALGRAQDVAAAELKIMASIPPELANVARRSADLFHLDTSNWYARADDTPHLTSVAGAAWTQRVVEMTYERWRAPEIVTRAVAPLGLVLKNGTWYLVAATAPDDADGAPDSTRAGTYRVSQIRCLTVTDRLFRRPGEFALADHWRRSLDDFEDRRMHGLVARLAVTDAGLNTLLRHPVGAVAQAALRARDHQTRHGDGRLLVATPLESLQHAVPVILALGPQVEVLHPPALREAVRTQLSAMTGLYEHADAQRAPLSSSPRVSSHG